MTPRTVFPRPALGTAIAGVAIWLALNRSLDIETWDLKNGN